MTEYQTGGIFFLAVLVWPWPVMLPVVAIMTQPWKHGGGFLPASYVKWVEMAGALAIPLLYSASDHEVDSIFQQVNGVLLPGGDAAIGGTARRILRLATEANRRGIFFPVWGTCDGFQWMLQACAGEDSILTDGFVSSNVSWPLNLTAAARSSRLLKPATTLSIPFAQPPITLIEALGSRALTFNSHHMGVTPIDFERSTLKDAFQVLATDVDEHGRSFISLVEAKAMPFWGSQFHPEKNIFETGFFDSGAPFERINHSNAAVVMSQYFANFFVEQCRKSKNRFMSATELKGRLFYQARARSWSSPGFVQSYYFDRHGTPVMDSFVLELASQGSTVAHEHTVA